MMKIMQKFFAVLVISASSLISNTSWAIVNHPPYADAGGPYVASVGEFILFDGSASNDPDGDPLSFYWDFGDGNTASEATPIHAYNTQGIFSVTLSVEDGYGGISIATTTADISPVPLPAAVWLFGTGLLGLIGISKRKKAA